MQEVTNRFIFTDTKVDCNPGWYDIVLFLDSKIAKLAPDYKIIEISKKHGLLNYVITGIADLPSHVREEIISLILDTQNLSARICEFCGKSGSEGIANGEWGVRCKKCADQNWQEHSGQVKKYGL